MFYILCTLLCTEYAKAGLTKETRFRFLYNSIYIVLNFCMALVLVSFATDIYGNMAL